MASKTKASPSLRERGRKSLLALQVFVHPKIELANRHPSKVDDDAHAKDNIGDTILFQDAERSCYGNAPCGHEALSTKMLESMLELASTWSYRVSEITGGSHSKNSRHYAGVAIDVDMIGGEGVSANNKNVSGFMKKCRQLGATEVLGPGHAGHATHVHAAWPRDSK